jgi:catechol 2,3-dioxygenase-like lactoylglutathione lyase family enzyme
VDDWYARTVFFAKDAERSLRFYTGTLGFSVDWRFEYEGRADVFQVKLHGFALIVQQAYAETEPRVGQGRVFIGLEDGEQTESLRRQIEDKALETTVVHWGKPTRVIRDLDGNELFFWPSLTEADEEWRDRRPE